MPRHSPPQSNHEWPNLAIPDGLEDQLLALTVSKERPDLEEQKAEIISSRRVD